jgi:capsular exopolysaccharide synthesis family protein
MKHSDPAAKGLPANNDPVAGSESPSTPRKPGTLLAGLLPSEPGSVAAKPAAPNRARPGDLSVEDAVALARSGISIVRARWIWGAAAAVAAGLVVGLVLLRKPTEHTAVTTMLAKSTLDQILQTEVAPNPNLQDQENALRNHLSVMESRRFSVAITEEFTDAEIALVLAPYLKSGDTPSRVAFESFVAGRIGAERERGREFFELSFSHVDPDIAVMVADRIAATYLKLVQREFRSANLAASEILRDQARELQDEINTLEDQRRQYRIEHNIISVEENQGMVGDRLRRLDVDRSELRLQRVRLEAQLAGAQTDMAASSMPFDNPLLASFGNNRELRQELDRLEAQREVLASRYGVAHPRMRDIDASIRGVRQNLSKNFQLALRDLEAQLASVRAIEAQLQEEFNASFSEGVEIEKLANRYLLLGSEAATKRETLYEILRRVHNAGVVSQLPADVMRVVDPAFIQPPRLPWKLVYLVFTFGVAAAAFLGMPLLLHVLDERIKSATDVEKVLGKELLGGLPRLVDVRPEDQGHIVRNNVDRLNVEAVMSIVARIDLDSKRAAHKAFLVTSTAPGEGKSTIAANLASAFTRLGKRTVLVDCDFRLPRQHIIHRTSNERGFLAWARAGFPQEGLFDPRSLLGIQELTDGTHFIPAGGEESQPTQMLVAKPTAWLFDQLRSRYDVVLIDTPAAGLFQDALVLSRFAHDTLVVAREAKAPVSRIVRTIADVDKTQAPVLGVILNAYTGAGPNARLSDRRSYGQYGYGAPAVDTVAHKAAMQAS